MADEISSKVAGRRRRTQPSGGGRSTSGAGTVVAGTSGAPARTSGWRLALARLDGRDLWRGLLAMGAFAPLDTTVNVLTAQADNPHAAAWEPMLWEVSSTLVILALAWIPWLGMSLAPPDEAAAEGWRPKARFGLIHAASALSFSVLHVALFVAVRKAGYALMAAGPYQFGDRFPYELRKDVVTYVMIASLFWLVGYLRRRRDEPVRPVSFDIRDGARIIRAPLAEILAISSAGNYVEFHLSDGRRPLMRATLAAVEVELGAFGFVRAHRSWLVNATRVTGLRPDGAGDWTVELKGLEAPLSRRFPEALKRLMAG